MPRAVWTPFSVVATVMLQAMQARMTSLTDALHHSSQLTQRAVFASSLPSASHSFRAVLAASPAVSSIDMAWSLIDPWLSSSAVPEGIEVAADSSAYGAGSGIESCINGRILSACRSSAVLYGRGGCPSTRGRSSERIVCSCRRRLSAPPA